jgi:hypothetical protein
VTATRSTTRSRQGWISAGGATPHGGNYSRVTGTKHYHPPPDASSDPEAVEDSCVAVSLAVLVTHAVLKLWRVAYHRRSLAALNAGENLP